MPKGRNAKVIEEGIDGCGRQESSLLGNGRGVTLDVEVVGGKMWLTLELAPD